ncbi:condensation domain-containing protein (plasmid) [Streptomyces sp. NBC_01216]|uniref:condensation domain-containing protein n=1 Tax=Streptomyces sp. NBC_01216 TaxID=2903778 RepID=UPI002E147A48|nr:condensation domain-containing protein [Streptomyces sp. NBC_01216]
MLEQKSTRAGSRALSTRFAIPEHMTDTDLHAALHRMAQREPNLRAMSISLDGVEYANTAPVPITHVECDGEQSVRDFIAQSGRAEFGTDGGPFWKIYVLHHRGEDGRSSRTACAVLDHLITDRASMALMRRELSASVVADPGKGAGRYRQWVVEQRERFADGAPRNSAAGQFWRSHLGDTSPKRPTPLEPFARRPRGRHSGKVWAISEHVPVSPHRLRAACRSARATPLVLHLASVAGTIAQASDTTDMTLRLQTAGRGPRSAEMFGFLANTVPIRLRHAALGSFDGAVAAARSAWGQILPHQDTPLGFLEKLFDPSDSSGTGALAGRGQLVVNCFPDTVEGITGVDYADRIIDFPQDFLHLFIVPLASGGFMFRLSCGEAELDIEDGRILLNQLKQQLVTNVRAVLGHKPGGELCRTAVDRTA